MISLFTKDKYTEDEPKLKYTITGNGIVHIKSSELRKSKKVRDTARKILEDSKLTSQH